MSSSPRIYADHAATSFPKPPAVHEAVARYARELGASPGRGSYRESVAAGRILQRVRERAVALIGGEDPDHVIFTLNCSDALNLAIKGACRPGDHLICTAMDHNSVLRPFNRLAADGLATVTRVAADPATGLVDPEALEKALTPRTRLIAVPHGSNVTGTLQDLHALGAVARRHGALFLVDAAQTLGHVPLDLNRTPIDLLAAPGHKGLLGPLGTGLLYIRPGVERQMQTLREGGTGSVSELDTQPTFMPDRFEPGSHNTLGLAGLAAGLEFILERGVEALHRHELALIQAFLDRLAAPEHPNLTLCGPPTAQHRCAVFSVRVEGFEPQALSDRLESEHGVLTRSGLHCAPAAHATIGTADHGGTTRLSFGATTTIEQAERAAEALVRICRTHAAAGV